MSKAHRSSATSQIGGHAPSNRVPSDRRDTRQLAAGIDSLYWSAASGIAPDTYALLARARESVDTADRLRDVDGFQLLVAPRGAGRYPVVLDADEFRVQITDSSHLPTVYVQLRSAFIHEVGITQAVDVSRVVAAALSERRIDEPRVSRVDMYADFADWVIHREDLETLVTNAKIATHARAGTSELQTIMAGKTPLAVRIYRKDIEVRERGGFAPLFWSGHQGPVVRVEVQASAETLRRFGIGSVAEALSCHGDVWAWAVSDFLEARAPGGGDRDSWPTTAEWSMVQKVAVESFPRCGLVPFRVVQGRREKIVPALLGYLQSYAALENLREPRAVVRRLVRQFPDLTWRSSGGFGASVATKRARLPRAYRIAQESEDALASTRDRPPSPEGGDSEGSTVGSDA